MAISEIYTGTGSTTLVSTTTQTPLCSFTAPTTKRGWLVGVRVGVGATNEAAGTACLFQLYKLTNASSVANTTTNAVTPNDPSAPASLCTFLFSASGTWTTAPTGVVNAIWQQEVPATAGSSWEEFPPAGYEYCTGPGGTVAGYALWATLSVSSTTTVVNYQLVWSE